MGVCESENMSPNLVKIDEEIKNLSKEYSLKNSIHENLKDSYKLKSQIGEGGYGKVFIATDKKGKKYAIKCINKKKIFQAQSLSNEIRMGIKMNHPNIVGIKEIYEEMNKIFLVMEYCEGGDLFEYITNSPQGKLDEKNSIDIIIQILDALNYLHNEVKICHRDLKPENCLIRNNGKNKPFIKLIDFGTAEYIHNGKRISGKIGTLKYMAPEIFVNPFYNEKIDLWSAGVILYNMVTGCEPFELNTKEFKKKHIFNIDINFDYIKNEDIRELCKDLLKKNPHKRIDAKTALEKAKNIRQKFLMNFNE
jgi:calcium-dependent protein kinase